MNRKDFFRKMAIGGSILVVAPMILDSCSKSDDDMTNTPNDSGSSNSTIIDLGSSEFSALSAVGGYAYKNNILIVRTGEQMYVALSKICTHQGCTVEYNKNNNTVPCACHGSLFNIDGAVLNGPATASLKKYSTKLEGNKLTIS